MKHYEELLEELFEEHRMMVNAELRKKAMELRINELERLILLNEMQLITRDYDHVNDDYWDEKYEEIEKWQVEIDEIKPKGSF